jgi:hypothetical protein
MRFNRSADRGVIGLRNCLEPFPVLLRALLRRRNARGANWCAKSAMSDGVLVARLTALMSDHSFSTPSQNLRDCAFDYPSGVQGAHASAKIPFWGSQHTHYIGPRLAPAIIHYDLKTYALISA